MEKDTIIEKSCLSSGTICNRNLELNDVGEKKAVDIEEIIINAVKKIGVTVQRRT